MKHDEFRSFLSKEMRSQGKKKMPMSENAIKARISRAGRIEKELNVNLDEAVKDINNLKELKKQIKTKYDPNISSTLYNTATRYYKFVHGEEPEKSHKDFLKL